MGDQTPRGVKRIFALACRPALAPRAEFFFCRDYFWARFELVCTSPSIRRILDMTLISRTVHLLP